MPLCRCPFCEARRNGGLDELNAEIIFQNLRRDPEFKDFTDEELRKAARDAVS